MPYIFSLTIFLLATIWCALAQGMTEFVIARAVCGLGAGGEFNDVLRVRLTGQKY
jgi:MFS family permease